MLVAAFAMFTIKKKSAFLLIILICFSLLLRFYNLNWGAPFYFHPDERNIASSVSQLRFPQHLNPNFFAYGSVPIYTIYFTGVLANALYHTSPELITAVSFSQAIIISRFFSALLSIALIPLLFFIGKKIKDEKTGLIAAFFASSSVGFIQFAHFGTFEMWLTFFTVVLFGVCLKIIRGGGFIYMILAGLVTGILIGTKISHIVLLPLPILALFFRTFKLSSIKTNLHANFLNTLSFLKQIILLLIICVDVFFLTNPYVLSDYSSFKGSMKYESQVALGSLPVFYTGEFKDSVPIVFQFFNVYPFLLNPVLTVLFIPCFIYAWVIAIKHKHIPLLLVVFCFLLLFFSQAFLYVKWIRYMVPTLPFIYLICAFALSDFFRFRFFPKRLALGILIGVSFLFSISYFITAFVQEDTRMGARRFATQFIQPKDPILSEVYDLGIVPFNDAFSNIALFNFYDLDNNSFEYNSTTLDERLAVSDYIILPSQRILRTRLQDLKNFPEGHRFYKELTNGVKFKKIYETPCDIFCRIAYLNNPIGSFEETASVFDRPSVMIFEKR